MYSARCLSVGLVCLLGACVTPNGRGSEGGLFVFPDGGLGFDVLEADAVDELDVEASLLDAAELVLKHDEGKAEPARDGAYLLDVEPQRHAVHRCSAILTGL